MERRILQQRIRTDTDVATVHRKASQLSELAGLENGACSDFAMAVSDVCKNMLKHIGEAKAEFLIEEFQNKCYLEAIVSNNDNTAAG
ncbi:MAG: hypothetical protein EOP53_25930, partial [Sphingobacteriales bacterium]